MSAPGRLSEWEGRPVSDWRERWGVPALIALGETASTNDIARRMAEQGAPAGLLVMTEHQTAGRGRLKRPWTDEPGRSLLCSFVLRPAAGRGPAGTPSPGAPSPGAPSPGTAPLRAGLAVAAALRDAARVDARLKWPNDIVTDRGKLAGILCEAATGAGGTVIIAGVGINVLQQEDDWPEELRGQAVSVSQESGSGMSGEPPRSLRASLMEAVAAAMRPLFTRPLEPLDNDELRAYAALDALHGLDITVTGPAPMRGIASGITADGALLLDADGTIQRVTSGTVRVASPIPHTPAGKPR